MRVTVSRVRFCMRSDSFFDESGFSKPSIMMDWSKEGLLTVSVCPTVRAVGCCSVRSWAACEERQHRSIIDRTKVCFMGKWAYVNYITGRSGADRSVSRRAFEPKDRPWLSTKIRKGVGRGKRKHSFQIDYDEPPPILV